MNRHRKRRPQHIASKRWANIYAKRIGARRRAKKRGTGIPDPTKNPRAYGAYMKKHRKADKIRHKVKYVRTTEAREEIRRLKRTIHHLKAMRSWAESWAYSLSDIVKQQNIVKESVAKIPWRSEKKSAYSEANVRKYKAELPNDIHLSATNAPQWTTGYRGKVRDSRWTVRARKGRRSVVASGYVTRKEAALAVLMGLHTGSTK
jgi:hypothetical protein